MKKLKIDSLSVRLPESSSAETLRALVSSVNQSVVCCQTTPNAPRTGRLGRWWTISADEVSCCRLFEELITGSIVDVVELPTIGSLGPDMFELMSQEHDAALVEIIVGLREGGKLANNDDFKKLLYGLCSKATSERLFPDHEYGHIRSLYWTVKVPRKYCEGLLADLPKFPSVRFAELPSQRKLLDK